MNITKNGNMTEGNISWILIKTTMPMLLSMASMMIFNLIDTYFIGQLGKLELAALSLTFPIILTIGSIAHGLGIGVSALISRIYGEGDLDKLKRLMTDSLSIGLIIVIILVPIGLLTIEPIFKSLGATKETLPLVKQYMTIWYIGVIFVIIPMIGNSAFRGLGDTKTPCFIMMVAVITNIILDPLLIFGIGPFPAMGISGAALATVIARAITLFASLWILLFRKKFIKIKNRYINEIFINWKEILHIGLPNAGSRIIIPIGIGIITSIVSIYGNNAIAAYGIGSKIEMFALSIIIALSSVLVPFIGQNLGAKKYKRAQIGLKYSIYFSFIWSFVLYIILFVYAWPIATLFNNDNSVNDLTASFIRIVSTSYGFLGVYHLSIATLNTLKKPFLASLLIIIETFVLCIPLAMLGSYFLKENGIFIGISGAYILTGILSYIFIIKLLNRMVRKKNN